MQLNLKSLIFYTSTPGVVADFMAYVFDLDLHAKNCDHYELTNSLYPQFPKQLIFRKSAVNDKELISFDFVIELENKKDWDDQFKKIVFYLHQNELNDQFSPSQEIRKPGGVSFHVTLLPGIKLEFFHPLHSKKNIALSSKVRVDLINDKKILFN